MHTKMIIDVPSPIDLRFMPDAREWEQTAMSKRPWRTEFFARLASEIGSMSPPASCVLELGSGPGFLALHLLGTLSHIKCTLLDFSPAMHQLAIERLGEFAKRAEFIERNFKQVDWPDGLGEYECVVTNQAVHELRHKSYAPRLHAQVRKVLAPNGVYLVCDHFAGEGGMKDNQLYMSVGEQKEALFKAGFLHVEELMRKRGLVLHRAA
jgi:ubiquinone/menaquinone biosynthesis C-methylase UbiE